MESLKHVHADKLANDAVEVVLLFSRQRVPFGSRSFVMTVGGAYHGRRAKGNQSMHSGCHSCVDGLPGVIDAERVSFRNATLLDCKTSKIVPQHHLALPTPPCPLLSRSKRRVDVPRP